MSPKGGKASAGNVKGSRRTSDGGSRSQTGSPPQQQARESSYSVVETLALMQHGQPGETYEEFQARTGLAPQQYQEQPGASAQTSAVEQEAKAQQRQQQMQIAQAEAIKNAPGPNVVPSVEGGQQRPTATTATPTSSTASASSQRVPSLSPDYTHVRKDIRLAAAREKYFADFPNSPARYDPRASAELDTILMQEFAPLDQLKKVRVATYVRKTEHARRHGQTLEESKALVKKREGLYEEVESIVKAKSKRLNDQANVVVTQRELDAAQIALSRRREGLAAQSIALHNDITSLHNKHVENTKSQKRLDGEITENSSKQVKEAGQLSQAKAEFDVYNTSHRDLLGRQKSLRAQFNQRQLEMEKREREAAAIAATLGPGAGGSSTPKGKGAAKAIADPAAAATPPKKARSGTSSSETEERAPEQVPEKKAKAPVKEKPKVRARTTTTAEAEAEASGPKRSRSNVSSPTSSVGSTTPRRSHRKKRRREGSLG